MVCFLGSFNRSEVCIHAERVRLLLKFRFRVEFFDFVVSLPCEWSWAIRLSAAIVVSPEGACVLVRGSYTTLN
jgi:hypothetical protein